jgi:hypothetical protein
MRYGDTNTGVRTVSLSHLSHESPSAHLETRRKLPYSLNFLRSGGDFFDTRIQDIRPQTTTHDVPATTKSANKKKMTKDLHQTYVAVFLSSMSMFQATQTVVKRPPYSVNRHRAWRYVQNCPFISLPSINCAIFGTRGQSRRLARADGIAKFFKTKSHAFAASSG